jgi:hypothetical protein
MTGEIKQYGIDGSSSHNTTLLSHRFRTSYTPHDAF